eukprot:COSAG02_NODE_8811_length_2436_cov_1.494651_4_plen_99_part_00
MCRRSGSSLRLECAATERHVRFAVARRGNHKPQLNGRMASWRGAMRLVLVCGGSTGRTLLGLPHLHCTVHSITLQLKSGQYREYTWILVTPLHCLAVW